MLERKQEFNLNELIAKVQSLLFIPEDVQIKYPQVAHRLNFSIIALEQILINLISNAIRYDDKPEDLTKISFAEDGAYYFIEVEDNGMG